MNEEVISKVKERSENNPFVRELGVEFLKVEEGRVEARMPLQPKHKQYSGVVHGGVLAALLDTVAGFAAYTVTPTDKEVLSAEIKTSFLKASWGEELRAIGYVIKPGRTLHFCECEIYCGEKLVCKGSGTFCVVQPRT